MKRLLFIYLLLFAVHGWAQRLMVAGHLISDENAQPVQLASLLNVTSGQKAISNRQGYFRMYMQERDTVRISAVGFETMNISWADLLAARTGGDTAYLLMHSVNYQLNQVTIVYSNRKRDSIARLAAEFLKTDPLMNNNDRILKRPRGNGLSGVITEMYYEFSKEGQDMVHFEEFVKYYREVQAADKKYNKEIIKRTTNLPDYMLDDYILFCKMDRQFVLYASEYDLVKAIKDCGDRYKAKNGIQEK